MGMYLRITERRNRDGSTVAYYALAENIWNPEARRSETRVVHSFGRADQLDKAALQRLVASINRVIDSDAAAVAPTDDRTALPEIAIEAVFELGVVLTARRLWEDLGIGEAIRTRMVQADLAAPHETALFAMAAQRLDDPGSKRACATRWLADVAWLPEAEGITVDQLYRALDVLAVWSEEIERAVFLRAADLLRLDIDLIFYDTTTAYFEIDEPDEYEERFAGKLFAPLRQRGHSKEGRDANQQVVIALAVTRDGMPVHSWVLPGNTADVATVSRIKQDLHAWRLGRYVLAVPMRRVREDVDTAVLTRPGRYRQVTDNLQVKEVWVGDGERRKRYVLCFNPLEAERQRQHRLRLLAELDGELTALDRREEDHPKAACALMASKRYARYLTPDWHGRPRLDAAKVRAAEKFDGKFVVITNDETWSAEDVALAYKAGAMIESCFRRMKQTGLEVRPMFHWTARRIEAHVKLCVLALQMQRSAEIRTGLPWARIAHALTALKAVRYASQGRTIVQRAKIGAELGDLLKKLGIPILKQILLLAETAARLTAA